LLGLVWQHCDPDHKKRTHGLDQNLRSLFCSLFVRRIDTWMEGWVMHGVEWVD
jgi:hypothetical protein